MYSCDVTIFHQKLKNSNQGNQRRLLFSGHGLSAQPYLKQPWSKVVFTLNSSKLGVLKIVKYVIGGDSDVTMV